MAQSAKHTMQAVVLGVSAGGVAALKTLLGGLPPDFPLPVLIVQHIAPHAGNSLAHLLDEICKIHVKEADECETPLPGTVYLSPPNYHLLVEQNGTLSLSTDPPVCFARPSIDVLFESAAQAYGAGLIGVILTGANFDGSQGLKRIKEKGGVAIVQDPADAEVDSMPRAALAAVQPDYLIRLDRIASLLQELVHISVPSPTSSTAKNGRAKPHKRMHHAKP